MEKNWRKIYSTTELYKAQIIKEILDEEDIEVVYINKKDSTYGSFGDVEIYVHVDKVLPAKNMLLKHGYE